MAAAVEVVSDIKALTVVDGGRATVAETGAAPSAKLRPGQRGNPGRPKGSKNKHTRTIEEKLKRLGHDPIVGMARIAMNRKNPVEIRLRAMESLAPYIAPKRKAVEVSAAEGSEPFVFQFIAVAADE